MCRCKRCGELLIYSGMGRPRKYCKECAVVEKLEYDRARMLRKRNLGTSDFFEHAVEDFDREKQECLKELRRLGIKRQFS